jgi:hypothetical protein
MERLRLEHDADGSFRSAIDSLAAARKKREAVYAAYPELQVLHARQSDARHPANPVRQSATEGVVGTAAFTVGLFETAAHAHWTVPPPPGLDAFAVRLPRGHWRDALRPNFVEGLDTPGTTMLWTAKPNNPHGLPDEMERAGKIGRMCPAAATFNGAGTAIVEKLSEAGLIIANQESMDLLTLTRPVGAWTWAFIAERSAA